jgi:predicted DNA-binding transcriptional regulator AlpA
MHGYSSSPAVTLAPMAELAGLAELARLFGVSKATARKYSKRDGFPPSEQLASGPVWRLADVEAWAAENLREQTRRTLPRGRPPSSS